jgi:acyl carrier protein
MIPDDVHFVPSIPMTASGKVDEKRLPRVEARMADEAAAARSEMQKELAGMMRRILRTPRDVSVKDDFFVIGGQSLAAVELISEINDRYGVWVNLREFCRQPTVEHLEALVTARAGGLARA